MVLDLQDVTLNFLDLDESLRVLRSVNMLFTASIPYLMNLRLELRHVIRYVAQVLNRSLL